MREKQIIEEMTKDLCDIECKGMKCDTCDGYACEYRMQAEALYNAGYRKQSEGEWIYYDCVSSFDGTVSGYACSCCNTFIHEDVFSVDYFPNKYCPDCGARMKGGAE